MPQTSRWMKKCHTAVAAAPDQGGAGLGRVLRSVERRQPPKRGLHLAPALAQGVGHLGDQFALHLAERAFAGEI